MKVGDIIIKVDARYFRPTEVEALLGDAARARQKLGWIPEVTVQQMCREMVQADLLIAKRYALLKTHGFALPVSIED